MKTKNTVRIVTAAALFDGHDASINIMRRILQDFGAEVIHLGHNRSVQDVVKTVLQEGAQGVCVSSYQGGHMEYFKYMKDLLDQAGAGYVKIFGGGGGVIVHDEKRELEAYGITQIFHPDDGRKLGLEGMIAQIIEACDFSILDLTAQLIPVDEKNPFSKDPIPSTALGLAVSAIEESKSEAKQSLLQAAFPKTNRTPCVVGITGTGGAGKSSLIDELVQRFLNAFPEKNIAVVCVDPSKRKTGGSLLGDRIRMNSLSRPQTFMRSLASRGSGREISDSLPAVVNYLRQCDFDLIIAETSGIGQGNMAITEVSDLSMYVMTAEFGAPSQLEKIDMIDFADLIAINKADRRGAKDAQRDVAKQYKRSRKIFDDTTIAPVFLTQASQFNDGGLNQLFFHMCHLLEIKNKSFKLDVGLKAAMLSAEEQTIIPSHRQAYLSEIVDSIRTYKKDVCLKAEQASRLGALQRFQKDFGFSDEQVKTFQEKWQREFAAGDLQDLLGWDQKSAHYDKDEFTYKIRGKEFKQALVSTSLSGTKIRKVAFPKKLQDWGDRFRYLKLENVPGEFPFTAGVFPLKREDEEPKRMFAGEGTPERTNRRFHYLCEGEASHRLSTAFDSVTLYGQDPEARPDIYGKVGESGVSICTLADMKRLYAGFDLINPNTSVSMTINGPAPMILAFYFNTAIDQQVELREKKLSRSLSEREWQQVADETLKTIRGTVQADILKEDQGQNTCIFSINFALKMMGDIQAYFVEKEIKNFYSVSISGYHIAEAGANPISQLAFTLANGFTFVEYYLARGLNIDDFAPNLSFFFSNGLDPEYSVIGRVARRIWALAMKNKYNAGERSQKLKYHIQTSGRSLHAQEIAFNDIRTTLQALLAIYDNCNSLHTNAYDEAITTPTEESVRRAMAIQMIINREYGVAKNQNPNQGSYFLEEMTELVEEAVLEEFLRLSERGGVLGSMETQYQRAKIQEESLYYERLKHDGTLPIIGVNTFVDPKTMAADFIPAKIELARASYEEKDLQLRRVQDYQKQNEAVAQVALAKLKATALRGENVFGALMIAARSCSLFQMTEALFEVGGQYRRNV